MDGGATVVITIAVIAGLVAIAGLGVVATVCILGINAGYRVEAVHRIRSKTDVFDDELTIIRTAACGVSRTRRGMSGDIRQQVVRGMAATRRHPRRTGHRGSHHGRHGPQRKVSLYLRPGGDSP